MRFIPILLFFLLCSPTNSWGQEINLPPSFQAKLDAVQLQFVEPQDDEFRGVRIDSTHTMPYDYAYKVKKKKLEIRYYILPFKNPDSPFNSIPQMHLMRYLTNIATNEESAMTAVHSISDSELIDAYAADWGIIATFPPKISFSSYPHCKLLSLYKTDRGMAFVYFLFKDPNLDIEPLMYTLQFKE